MVNNIATKTTAASTKSAVLRDAILLCIRDIRECRSDRAVPCLIGQGWTVAIKGSPACIARIDGGFNFSGSWNRRGSFFEKGRANELLAKIAPNCSNEVEVVHCNTIRDRSEETSLNLLKELLSLRSHR